MQLRFRYEPRAEAVAPLRVLVSFHYIILTNTHGFVRGTFNNKVSALLFKNIAAFYVKCSVDHNNGSIKQHMIV